MVKISFLWYVVQKVYVYLHLFRSTSSFVSFDHCDQWGDLPPPNHHGCNNSSGKLRHIPLLWVYSEDVPVTLCHNNSPTLRWISGTYPLDYLIDSISVYYSR